MLIELEKSEILAIWAILVKLFGDPKMKRILKGYKLNADKNHPIIKSLIEKMNCTVRGENAEPYYLR